MILSHKHKFIFLCNGKTGTTSIEKLLGPLQEGSEYDVGISGLFVAKHIPPAILKSCLPEHVWREYYKFVFVRNPWDWFVSNWFWNSVRRPSAAEGHAPRTLRARIANRLKRMQRRLGLLPSRPAMDQPLVYDAQDVDHLFQLLRQYRGLPGKDGYYQSNWVYDMQGEPLVDFIGRFENLAADFAAIKRKLGLEGQLSHLNSTGHASYRRYFSPEAVARVAELWEVDVRNFNYSF